MASCKSPIIFTEYIECQDCFKCIRECPVKAIKVENTCAAVMPQLCVLCGHCVEACPNGAKLVRDDLSRAQHLLESKDKVYASLAPSFVSEFPDIPTSAIIRALKKLGFAGVSETALGAELVSGSVAHMLQDRTPRLIISTACPVVVNTLKKYHPQVAPNLMPYVSPVLAHCQLLRDVYGPSIGIVFFSPCIAKKGEADENPELLDIALTFEDLRRWLQLEGIGFDRTEDGPEDVFVPYAAREGALYPMDGGMVAGVKAGCSVMESDCMSFSGMRNIRKALEGLDETQLTQPIFLELLACEGGCINGPKASRRTATIAKRFQVIHYANYPQADIPRPLSAPAWKGNGPEAVPVYEYNEKILKQTLLSIGKYSPEDELNCGGCGYDNCREFAKALIERKAEKVMCVGYMRKLAQKKANVLMEKTPSAIILVDDQLRVVECNLNFARLLGTEVEEAYADKPGLEGVFLRDIAPFYSLFKTVLEKGEDLLDRDLRYKKSVLHIDVFSIEKHQVVCGIFQDITRPTIHKEAMIQKAQDVIKKNLETVQQIAYLLGENAAESEVILNSIIHSIKTPEVE